MAPPNSDLVCVVLAGGAGTRFWPASTETRPKQFLALTAPQTLLQLAVERVVPLVGPERVLVLTAEPFVALCREQLPMLPADNILGEPCRRDTAAAIALATAVVEDRFPGDTVQALLTADHHIAPVDVFQKDLLVAVNAARQAEHALFTFGIPPTFAATGYGYLALGAALDDGIHQLKAFVEKPDRARAEAYVQGGAHLWNSGMFVWRTRAIRRALEAFLPEHLAALAPAVQKKLGLATAFAGLAPISIDFGVMEKAEDVRCVRTHFHWNDVGGFAALAEHLPLDTHHNAVRGVVHSRDATDNIVWCEDEGDVVALIGVQGLVVVRAGDRTLVVPKDRVEEIKQLVQSLPATLR